MRRDPNMPKKPLSAYIYFCQEAREQIKGEALKLPVASIMKECSNRWSTMTKPQREPYSKAAKDDKIRYEKEIYKIKDSKIPEVSKEEETPENDIKRSPCKSNYLEIHDNRPIKIFKNDEYSSINQMPAPQQETPKPKTSPDSQFRFSLPENKPNNSNYQDTNSGSTDYNQQNPYMYRNNMFSPMQFGGRPSPTVSPNMIPMYSPMMMRGNQNRGPSVMGQSNFPNVNKNEITYNDYNILASPNGFTPVRTNLQKPNPIFSPAQNYDAAGLFGPSPGMNNFSYQPFSYGRTPVNQFPNNQQRFMPRPINPAPMPGQDQNKRQPGNINGLFDLNPFGSS
jgi:hypothetical protein